MSEKDRPIRIHFSLGAHSMWNLSQLGGLHHQAETFFSTEPNALNVYFHESLGVPDSEAQRLWKLHKRYGSYLDANLALELQMKRLPQTPENMGQERDLRLNPNDYRAFIWHELRMLDSLAETRNFELNYESLPDTRAKQVRNRFHQSQEARSDTIKREHVGDIEGALDAFVRQQTNMAVNMRERNLYYLQRIVYFISFAEKRKRPARLFVRIGETHHSLVDRVSQQPKISQMGVEVSSEYEYGEPLTLAVPPFRIYLALEAASKTTIDREEWLKGIVGQNIIDELDGVPLDQRVKRAGQVVDSSTTEELEKLIRSFPSVGFKRALSGFIAAKIW